MNPNTKQSKIKPYFHLFAPSPSSLLFSGFLTFLIIGLHQVGELQRYLGLPADIEFMRIFMLWLDQTLTGILGEARTNAFVVGTFWAIVGLAVYVFLQALARFIYDLGEGIEERHYVWPRGSSRFEPVKRAIEQATFRSVAFCSLIYLLFQPLARLIDHIPFEYFIGPNKVLQYFVWVFSLIAVLHICIVLMRLVALRPRLFD